VKYAVVTFGCRVNQADSLEIEGGLLARGGVCVPPAEADVVVVNTCSVTGAADQGARQTIRKVARENPAARILVTGCYATRQPDDLASLPGVVRIVPNPDSATRGRMDRAVRRCSLAWRAGRPLPCACRPGATRAAATASSPPRVAPGDPARWTGC
jgi:threonylcarbamoyladenosine tRNA methylthiotransferase MtaB